MLVQEPGQPQPAAKERGEGGGHLTGPRLHRPAPLPGPGLPAVAGPVLVLALLEVQLQPLQPILPRKTSRREFVFSCFARPLFP